MKENILEVLVKNILSLLLNYLLFHFCLKSFYNIIEIYTIQSFTFASLLAS